MRMVALAVLRTSSSSTTHKTCTCNNNEVARQRQSKQENSYFSKEKRTAALGGNPQHSAFQGSAWQALYQLSFHGNSQLVWVQFFNTTQHKGKPETTVLWHSILSHNVYACISYCGYSDYSVHYLYAFMYIQLHSCNCIPALWNIPQSQGAFIYHIWYIQVE